MKCAWPYDIAVASVLGGLLALTVALTFGLSPFLWPLLGVVAGPLCYKPGEVAAVTVACIRDLWKAVREGGLHVSFPPVSFPGLWRGVGTGTFVVGCIICVVVSLVTLPLLVMLLLSFLDWLPSVPLGDLLVAGGVVVFLSTIFGGAITGIFLNVPELRSRWAMPLSRWVVLPLLGADGFVPLKKEDDPERKSKSEPTSKKDNLLFCLLLPPLCQGMALLASVLVLDLLITIVLACASTRRIASMLGATLCCTGAAIAALCGITFAPALLVIGANVGWCAGPSLYLLREFLAAAPATVPVES